MDKVSPRFTPPRDERYLGLAWTMASFSKDPNTQVGAVIILPEENEPLGWGYNGPPAALDDNKDVNWARPHKYDFIKHAEENAIDHSSRSLNGAHLYVTHMPCKKCMLKIIDAKITRVVYTDLAKKDPNSSIGNSNSEKEFIEELAYCGGVQLEKFEGNLGWLPDWVEELKGLGLFEISK